VSDTVDHGDDTVGTVKKTRPGTFSSNYQPKQRRAGDKLPRNVKEDVIAGLAAVGEDGAGKGGFRGYVAFLGRKYPKQAARLVERLLPPSVVIANNTPGQRIGTVNIVSIPSGTFLKPHELAQLQEEHTIDHEPELPEVPAPEPEPIEHYPARIEFEAPAVVEEIVPELSPTMQRALALGYTPLPRRPPRVD
jgi:hypothetical protein